MKVSINQTNVSRVGINTARIQGIRLGSASKGGQTYPFHPSLVDYWNFKGKSNFDKDRSTIKGIKGEILTAYNFGWSLGSGYGLYGTDFRLQWNDSDSSYGKIVNSTTAHTNKVGSGLYVIAYGNRRSFADTFKGRITGMPEGYSLYIGYASKLHLITSQNGDFIINKSDIPGDVVNEGENIVLNGGFKIMKTGNLGGGQEVPCDVTIELIPEYQGAIVTDGVDDYLKLDKVGYKIGTVILKYTTLFRDNTWRYVFDVQKERAYLASNKETGVFVTSMQYKFAGDYMYLIPRTSNNPTTSNTPLYIGSNSIVTESARMALYDIAIYEDILTDEEIYKEIKVMEYGTPNPVFALNFDNFAYKAVDYPEFATGKVTTNKIVIDSTTTQMNGFIVAAYNPELTTGDAIELPSYKVKVTGIDAYGNIGDGYWAIALMGMPINASQDPWVYLFYKDGIYDIPAISLSESIYNLAVMCQIMVDKPIEIEILYDKNITKSFPETKQIFP